MRQTKTTLLLVLILALGLGYAKSVPITYTFVPDITDFNSIGFGGSITLDVPASNSGSIANVLAVNIFGPYINPEQFDPTTRYLTSLSPSFSWTPTLITTMDLSVRRNDDGYVFSVYDNGLYEAGMDAQAYGSWVASNSNVPDQAETWLLAGFSLMMLALIRHTPLGRRVFASR